MPYHRRNRIPWIKPLLITGGTGFLGSNLCAWLLREGRRVICLDTNYAGLMENIAGLVRNENFRSVQNDVCAHFDPSEHLDKIYNPACPASPPTYQGKHFIDTTRTCVLGAPSMPELAKKYNARILQASTLEVYGEPLEHPQKETYRGNVNPIGICACYDEGKHCAEILFFDYHRHKGLSIRVIRISIRTEGGFEGRACDVPNFINQTLRGEGLTIYGEGTQTRSFCYVDDLIEGIVRTLAAEDESFTGPVNLGNPSEFTICELSELVLVKVGGSSRMVQRELPADAPTQRKPDITLAQQVLSWSPKVSLAQGLDITIEYSSKHKSRRNEGAIIGTGYVGLPTGAGLAGLGYEVCCVDCIHEKVEMLRAGKVILYEEGLGDLLKEGLKSGRLLFTADMQEEVEEAQVVTVAVGTPEDPNTGEADLTCLFTAVEQLAKCLKPPAAVAIKSTVPVGTGDKAGKLIRKINPNVQAEVISLPEFLREGYAVHDFFHPARIVIGTENEETHTLIRELYAPMHPDPKFLCVARRSSEVIRYASISFLAMKIHFINEMADFCETIGANIHEVTQGMGPDACIGSAFLKPGLGYGGSCFPKDTKALLYMVHNAGVELSLVRSTIAGNAKRLELVAHEILEAVKDIPNPRIAVWGLAFKDGTDDCRENPAIVIVQHFLERPNVTVAAYTPKAMNNVRKDTRGKHHLRPKQNRCREGSPLMAILTDWTEFVNADMEQMKSSMTTPARMID